MNKQLLKIAGKELLQGNLGNAVSTAVKSFNGSISGELINSSNYRSSSKWFFSSDGSSDVHFGYGGVEDARKAYERCSPVTSIINRMAMADANGIIKITNTLGKAKDKEATGEQAAAIKRLLTKPNILMSGTEFMMRVKIFKQTFGWCIIIPTGIPTGFPAWKAKSWWIVDPTMLNVTELNEMFTSGRVIDQIVVAYKGFTLTLNTADILIIKDLTPSFDSLILPESRLKSLSQEINNIIGAYESRGVMIDKRGPDKIISSGASDESGSVALTKQEKTEVQEEFAETYGLRKNQWRSIITNQAIKVQEIGFNVAELGLHEEVQDDIDRICDAYVFPRELMASQKGSSFNNGYNGDKMLYQNAVIPDSIHTLSQFAVWLDLATYNLAITKDFSHLAALQENKKEQADANLSISRGNEIDFRNNVITVNEWRASKNMEPITEPHGNMYYSDLKDQLSTPVTAGQIQEQNGQQTEQNAGAATQS